MADVQRVMGSLQQRRAALALDTADLCFLLALRDRAERNGTVAFDEETLYETFDLVCDMTSPEARNPTKRGTHAIQRLREQRLLARVDGAGLVRAGEYAVTSLGKAIVDFFLQEETLTRESLTLLTKMVISQLAQVLDAARRARTQDAWKSGVGDPLRIAVGDLIQGIERRQLGLDAQQEEIQGEVESLLRRDWFSAVETCEALLQETTKTLQELQAILLRDQSHLQALLNDIEVLAQAAEAEDAVAAAQRVSDQLDRISAWGGARLHAWSEYYQFVQRYLRSVVRLDPERALSRRLRDQLAGWMTQPFYLAVAGASPLHVLRPEETTVQRPRAARPIADRERPIDEVDPDASPAELETLVAAALADLPAPLSHVLARLLATIAPTERFRAIGRFTELAASHARVRPDRTYPWASLLDDFEVEEWVLEKLKERA